MADPVQAPKFEEHFWGPGNKGFDVLLHNYKVGIGATKELNEFIRERVSLEDSYVKGLMKLSKGVAAVPQASLGSLAPMWQVLHSMCDNLSAAHSKFIGMLLDLSREISDYHVAQKDKMKGKLKGEIEGTQDSLRLLETQDSALQRAKKLYTQSVEQFVKQQNKLEKTKGEINPKTRQQMEGRLKQTENWMETMKDDYKQSVEASAQQMKVFQGNMREACQKFGAIEEEHLAQMITFVMKMREAQETAHIQVGKAHQRLGEQIEANSVEKLLCAFVEAKGTGKEKPVPEKFRPVNDKALATLAAPVHDVHRNRSPSTDSQKGVKPEKSIRQRIRFKKKGKSSDGREQKGDHVISGPQEAIPTGEVDEEGYSIRPQDAAAIRGFPDDNANQDSDDSDFEDDFQSRVRQVQIRDPPQDLPKATVDDIRASVQTLQLGAQHNPSTRIRKATSSQSLNNILHTPPLERKIEDTIPTSSLDPTSSLLDSDISLSPSVAMVAPLQPLPLASFSSDPMEPLRPSWTQQPTPLIPSPISPPTTASSDSPSSSSGPPENAERPVPKPRRVNSEKGDLPRVPVTSSPETVPKKNSPSELAREGETQVKVPPSGWMIGSSDEELPGPPPAFPNFESPKSESSMTSSDLDNQTGILSPPQRNPRKNARQRGSTPSDTQPVSPLIKSHITTTPTTPTTPATPPTVVTPSPSTPSPSTTPTVQSSKPAPPTAVPLAIAFQETCNAIFKSMNPSDCLVKVTGEMVVSFPASLVGKVENYDRLAFKLKDTHKLKQVLHNQKLLTREGDSYSYHFNAPALSSHLATMASKKTAPFYNMQIIKYEVNISDGSQMPVRLTAYWKCTELVTNFRFDYSYIGSNLPMATPPPLTQVSVCVPVNGGVRNTLSRPSGSWLADKQQIVWKIGEVAPGDGETQTSIHAKFDVSEGPSLPQPAEVRFLCDGSTVSGVDLELIGTEYRVSLLKRKFSSGKYSAEMRF